MIQVRRSRLLLFVAIVLIAVTAATCSSEEPTPTVSSSPVAFPYIFSGTFTVNGEPGPQGIPMFARLGDARGPFNNSIRPGEYINVSVAPTNMDDIGGEITFFLGHPDEDPVKAEETFIFDPTVEPRFVSLNLSFPRLP